MMMMMMICSEVDT